MAISLEDFKDIEFPLESDFSVVYIIYFRRDSKDIYFYVGETSRYIGGRLGDYVRANFNAATDFKVGEAIRYLRGLGLYVGVRYFATLNRKEVEASLENELKSKGYKLLNDLKGYRYEESTEKHERKRIHDFMSKL